MGMLHYSGAPLIDPAWRACYGFSHWKPMTNPSSEKNEPLSHTPFGVVALSLAIVDSDRIVLSMEKDAQ
jgi:hypothetical protein